MRFASASSVGQVSLTNLGFQHVFRYVSHGLGGLFAWACGANYWSVCGLAGVVGFRGWPLGWQVAVVVIAFWRCLPVSPKTYKNPRENSSLTGAFFGL